MICEDCKVGGNFNRLGSWDKALELHSFCKGGCCCQHKTGPEVGSLAKLLAEPLRTQYPLE